MGQVVVEIGGRTYSLSCRDGDEAHLTGLAAGIADKAISLVRSLGPMSEPRLLLMAALMVADELHDVRRGKPGADAPAAAEPVAKGVAPAAAAASLRLGALVARAEALADEVAGRASRTTDPARAVPPSLRLAADRGPG